MNIGLDLDGVIFSFWKNFRDYLHLYHNKPMNEMSKNADSWEFYRNWGLSDEEFMKYFIQGINDGYIFRIGHMIDNASYYIKSLHNDGHKIYLISNRSIVGAEEMAYKNTCLWLQENDIYYDKLIFAKDKSYTVQEYKLDIFVEDSPKNAKQISEAGCQHILLFDQEWNIKDNIFHRVYSWNQIYDYIHKL